MTGNRLTLTMNDQETLRAWAAPRMGVASLASDMVLIGIMDGNEIVATVGFNADCGTMGDIHVASNGSRRWVNRRILRIVFAYAFDHRGWKRLNLVVPVWNKETQILAIKSGGVPEGFVRQAGPNGEDEILFGILADECLWWKRPESKESDGEQERSA